MSSDYQSAIELPAEYDTDLENYYTNPNNFMDSPGQTPTQAEHDQNMNTVKQKFKISDAAQKASNIMSVALNALTAHFSVDQSLKIETPALSVRLSKVRAARLNATFEMNGGKFNIPSFCDLTNEPTSGSMPVQMTPVGPLYNSLDENNCTNKIISVQVMSQPMAISGFNGDNETFIGMSSSIDLSFFDASSNPIKVENARKNIELWINRDLNASDYQYQYVNGVMSEKNNYNSGHS